MYRFGRFVPLSALVLAAAWNSSVFGASLDVRFATPMHKIMIQGAHQDPKAFPYESWSASSYNLGLAQNEREALQVVVIPDAAVENVNVSVGTLSPQEGQGSFNGTVSVWLVGYVDVTDNPITDEYADADFYPMYLKEYYEWWPDALLTFEDTCDIDTAYDRVPFWVDVSTLDSTPAGLYQATITISADGCTNVTKTLNVTVWDFELPVSSSLETAFSCQTQFAEALFDSDWDETLHYDMFDIMLEHRLNVAHLYLPTNPSYTWPVPESYINYWDSMDATMYCLGKIPNALGEDLADLVDTLDTSGLLTNSYVYGYDEKETQQDFDDMHEDFDDIHTNYSNKLRTMTTARDYTFGQSASNPNTLGLRDAVDIWVAPTDTSFDHDEALALREISIPGGNHKDLWWYNCCYPRHPRPNWFVEYPAIEARLLMGAMAYKHDPGGHLYWSVARWLNQDGVSNTSPITSGPYTSWDPRSFYHPTQYEWACGDGCLILPGKDGFTAMFLPTIRLENIRDGLEDYEYLVMLEDLVDTIFPGSTTAEIAFVSNANDLLDIPTAVGTEILDYDAGIHFTRDPDVLYTFREDLADAIEEGLSLISSTVEITGQPSAQNICSGSTAQFTVTATGSGTVTY